MARTKAPTVKEAQVTSEVTEAAVEEVVLSESTKAEIEAGRAQLAKYAESASAE